MSAASRLPEFSDSPARHECAARATPGNTRQKDNAGSDLAAASLHKSGHWHVVLRRSLGARNGLVRFASKQTSGIAFAVWSGANSERSGRKAFSGDFMPLELA